MRSPTLKTLAKGYVESKLLHGSALYGHNTEASNAMKGLNQVQRAALRVATGVLMITPECDQHLEANNLPIDVQAKIRALLLAEKEARIPPPEHIDPEPPPPGYPGTISTPPAQQRAKMLEQIIPGIEREQRLLRSQIDPWDTSHADQVTFGTPPDMESYMDEEELYSPEEANNKYEWSMEQLEQHQDYTFKVATDGSVREKVVKGKTRRQTTAAAILWTGENESADMTQPCGRYACSYRTEIVAIRNGLDLVEMNSEALDKAVDEGKTPKILMITDSLSSIQALQKGPLVQKYAIEDDVWSRLTRMTNRGYTFHFQFVYGHCGVPENEEADQLSNTIACGEPPTPAWEPDCQAFIKRHVKNEWLSTVREDTPRFKILGRTFSRLTGVCPITGEHLTREMQVQLARFRTSASEWFGKLYHLLRETNNLCRWCKLGAVESLPQEKEDTESRKKFRRKYPCPFCPNKKEHLCSLSLSYPTMSVTLTNINLLRLFFNL